MTLVKKHKNRLRKFFKILIIVFIAFFLSLVLIANLAEKKIAALAFAELRRSMELPIQSGDISFTLIRDFPLATVEFNDLILGSPKKSSDTTSLTDTSSLISIGKLFVSVRTTPLLDGIFDVQKVELSVITIHYNVNKAGRSNFDFLIDTTASQKPDTITSTPLNLTLQDLKIKDAIIIYSDSFLMARSKITIPEINLNAKIKNNTYSGHIEGNTTVTESSYKNWPVNLMKEARLDFEIGYKNNIVTINRLDIFSGEAELSATGSFRMKDSVKYADIKINGENIDIAELIKYIPSDTLKKYSIRNAKGILNFDASVSGVVSDSVQPDIKTKITLQRGALVTDTLPALKNIYFNIEAANGDKNNETTTKIRVNSFHIETDSSMADIKGTFYDLKNVRFNTSAKLNIYIDDIRKFIPDSLFKTISGNISTEITTKGIVRDSVDNDFLEEILQSTKLKVIYNHLNVIMDSVPEIKNLSGEVEYEEGNLSAKNINLSVPEYKINIINSSFVSLLSGGLLNPEKTTVDIQTFSLNTDSNHVTGSIFVNDLKHPYFNLSMTADLNMKYLRDMLPDSIINNISGNIALTANSSGKLNLDSISEQLNELIFKNSSIDISTYKFSVEMPDTLMNIDNLTSSIRIVPDSIFIASALGKYMNINFEGSNIKIVNLYDTYFENLPEQLLVTGKYHLGSIDYNMLSAFIDTIPAAGNDSINTDISTKEADTVNYTFLIKGIFSVDSFRYYKAVFKNISTRFNLKDTIYILDQLKFDGFNGKTNSSVRYVMYSDGRSVINTKHTIEDIDVKQLLHDFDNFKEYGNTEITDENISGSISSVLHTKIEITGDSLLENKTRVKGYFKIKNGGIYNYKPAMEMSEITGLKELDSIRFKTFDSNIFIFKNKLYIPKTSIVSNAMDIIFFGMQNMKNENDYEYHIQLHLRDVLKGKGKKILKKQQESGAEVSPEDLERGMVRLIYANTGKKHKAGFDSKKAQKKMSLKIKVQEKMLELIFYPQLVSFDTKTE